MTQPHDPRTRLTTWLLIAVIAVIVVRVLGVVVTVGLGAVSGALVSGTAMDPGTLIGMVAVVGTVRTAVVGLVSLAALVLAIVVAVRTADRGRLGGILVVAAVMLGPLLSWLLGMITTAVLTGDASVEGAMGLRGAMLGADVLVTLLVFAAMIVGAVMARRWAHRQA